MGRVVVDPELVCDTVSLADAVQSDRIYRVEGGVAGYVSSWAPFGGNVRTPELHSDARVVCATSPAVAPANTLLHDAPPSAERKTAVLVPATSTHG